MDYARKQLDWLIGMHKQGSEHMSNSSKAIVDIKSNGIFWTGIEASLDELCLSRGDIVVVTFPVNNMLSNHRRIRNIIRKKTQCKHSVIIVETTKTGLSKIDWKQAKLLSQFFKQHSKMPHLLETETTLGTPFKKKKGSK